MLLLRKFKHKQNYADGTMFKNVVPGTVWEHEGGEQPGFRAADILTNAHFIDIRVQEKLYEFTV